MEQRRKKINEAQKITQCERETQKTETQIKKEVKANIR